MCFYLSSSAWFFFFLKKPKITLSKLKNFSLKLRKLFWNLHFPSTFANATPQNEHKNIDWSMVTVLFCCAVRVSCLTNLTTRLTKLTMFTQLLPLSHFVAIFSDSSNWILHIRLFKDLCLARKLQSVHRLSQLDILFCGTKVLFSFFEKIKHQV